MTVDVFRDGHVFSALRNNCNVVTQRRILICNMCSQGLSKPFTWLFLLNLLCCCIEAVLKPNPDRTAKFLLVVIAMPPKKAEEKLSELLEEQLSPIEEAIEDLITNKAMAKHIDLLETKLVKKINEQAAEIDQLKTRHSHLEGRVAILENLVKLQEIKSDDVEQ